MMSFRPADHIIRELQGGKFIFFSEVFTAVVVVLLKVLIDSD